MKYYIATSLSRMDAHHTVRAVLNAGNHEITYDWTLHGSVKSVSKRRMKEVAEMELTGVSLADFVVVLLPGGYGTHIELGFALAKGKRIFLHSEDLLAFELGPQTNAFYHHTEVTRLVCPLAEVGLQINSVLERELLQIVKDTPQ